MRTRVLTFLEDRLATSVKFNGIFYPADAVCNAVLNCVFPMFYGNPQTPEYPLSRSGSGFKVKQDNKYVLFSSEHQHKSFEPDWAILPSQKEQVWTSGNGITFSYSDEEQLGLDVRMYDFSGPVSEGSIAMTGWYQLRRSYHWDKILGCIAFGYPTEFNMIYDNPDEISLNCIAATGEYLGETIGNLHGMRLDKLMASDPDGISGGPAFFLTRHGDVSEIIPAGIITNASRSVINFVHARKLQRFLSRDLIS